MNILLIISILLVVLFVGATIWIKKELPESISAMVYVLPKGGWRWLWSIWLWLVGVLTLAPAIEALDKQDCGFLPFLTMVSLVFVGAWPLFDTDHKKLHYTFGIIAAILSQVCVLALCPWWLLLWLVMAFLGIYAYFKPYPQWLKGKGVFIAEGICYIGLVCAIITS